MDNGRMRILFTVMLVGSTGCVEDRTIAEPPDQVDLDLGDVPTALGPDNTRFTPRICDARAWQITPDTKDSVLSVVPTTSGATVLAVPTEGGAVRAFRVDQRSFAFDADMRTVRDDRNYTSVSASIVADRFVVASLVDDKVALDIMRDDLGERFGLGDVSGSLMTGMVRSRETQVALVGGPTGVVATTFEGPTWQVTSTANVTKTDIVSLTAMSFHDDALLAYSTSGKECHLTHFATGRETIFRDGCDNARMAVDPATGHGTIVYEQAGNVMRTDLAINSAGSELVGQAQTYEGASSPRTVFDGHRLWVSYIDARGDIVIGLVDGNGNLISRALEGFRPSRNAYDLTVMNGGVWVVGIELDGFLAERICAVAD